MSSEVVCRGRSSVPASPGLAVVVMCSVWEGRPTVPGLSTGSYAAGVNRLAAARTLAAAAALTGLGALVAVGSAVAFVRRGSAGHLHPESAAPPAPVAL